MRNIIKRMANVFMTEYAKNADKSLVIRREIAMCAAVRVLRDKAFAASFGSTPSGWISRVLDAYANASKSSS